MVIFLHGPDTFRSRQKLRQIKERFRREVDTSGYNTATLDGRTLKVEHFERDLISAPFLAPKRLVVVEELFSGKLAATLEKPILELLQRPAAKNPIAVFWEGELPTGKKKSGPLLTFLLKSDFAEAFPKLSGSQLSSWYKTQTKRHGLALDPTALELLAGMVGDDLWRGDNELQKLAAFCHGRTGTTDDIQTLVSSDVEENIFALTDAIGQRRTADALRLLDEQQRAGVTPLELVAKISWHFRNLLLAKTWEADHGGRTSSWELADALGLHPFVAKKTLGQVTNFTLPELTARYRQLLMIDRGLKTGRGDPDTLLTLFLANAPVTVA